jgi:single-strand DNA-binding protein
VATGRLKQRSYETKEGEKRTSIELEIDEIGPSLRYSTAQVTKADYGGSSRTATGTTTEASADVWTTPGNYNDETPF